jgi:hypothetical protein
MARRQEIKEQHRNLFHDLDLNGNAPNSPMMRRTRPTITKESQLLKAEAQNSSQHHDVL